MRFGAVPSLFNPYSPPLGGELVDVPSPRLARANDDALPRLGWWIVCAGDRRLQPLPCACSALLPLDKCEHSAGRNGHRYRAQATGWSAGMSDPCLTRRVVSRVHSWGDARLDTGLPVRRSACGSSSALRWHGAGRRRCPAGCLPRPRRGCMHRVIHAILALLDRPPSRRRRGKERGRPATVSLGFHCSRLGSILGEAILTFSTRKRCISFDIACLSRGSTQGSRGPGSRTGGQWRTG
jgi:hypothetical protein